ncbi:hypothetical protein FKP32DRAFT_497560 [Trametes sanguinea]|nr:hypothetical protein FKP32DRAFT_497560 [Trametes sanguinea]
MMTLRCEFEDIDEDRPHAKSRRATTTSARGLPPAPTIPTQQASLPRMAYLRLSPSESSSRTSRANPDSHTRELSPSRAKLRPRPPAYCSSTCFYPIHQDRRKASPLPTPHAGRQHVAVSIPLRPSTGSVPCVSGVWYASRGERSGPGATPSPCLQLSCDLALLMVPLGWRTTLLR